VHVRLAAVFGKATGSWQGFCIYKRFLNPTNQQNCEMAKVKECTLEVVMSAIQQVSKRLDDIDKRFDKFELQLQAMENKFTLKCDKLAEDINELDEKIKIVCNRTAVVESTMTANNAAIEECFGKSTFY